MVCALPLTGNFPAVDAIDLFEPLASNQGGMFELRAERERLHICAYFPFQPRHTLQGPIPCPENTDGGCARFGVDCLTSLSCWGHCAACFCLPANRGLSAL